MNGLTTELIVKTRFISVRTTPDCLSKNGSQQATKMTVITNRTNVTRWAFTVVVCIPAEGDNTSLGNAETIVSAFDVEVPDIALGVCRATLTVLRLVFIRVSKIAAMTVYDVTITSKHIAAKVIIQIRKARSNPNTRIAHNPVALHMDTAAITATAVFAFLVLNENL